MAKLHHKQSFRPSRAKRMKIFTLATACFTMLATLIHLNSTTKINFVGKLQPTGSLIPRKIWQNYLETPVEAQQLSDTVSWLALHPDYEYTLMGYKRAARFIEKNSKKHQTLPKIVKEVKNTGIRSDLLRYLVLLVEGGVYSDIDTEVLKPIDHWVPEEYFATARVVIGIEFDRLGNSNWNEVHPDLQFCQWTIAAAPRHPVFHHMLDFIVSALEAFVIEHGTTFADIHISTSDVLQLTGPAAWTDVVFQQLQRHEPEIRSLRDLSGMTQPKLVGDILLLPIDYFGMGQPHSNSTNDGSVPQDALVRHKFQGSWRHGITVRTKQG